MSKAEGTPKRPQRTRDHIIASQSQNYIEKFILDKGHTVDRPGEDYGYDLIVSTFDEQGYAENGVILIQLKASDGFKLSKTGTFLSYQITRKHYELWKDELMPVFLVLYDAKERVAYWLDFQAYFASDPSRRPQADAKTLALRVPVANKFTEATVDQMRACKLRVLEQRRTSRGG